MVQSLGQNTEMWSLSNHQVSFVVSRIMENSCLAGWWKLHRQYYSEVNMLIQRLDPNGHVDPFQWRKWAGSTYFAGRQDPPPQVQLVTLACPGAASTEEGSTGPIQRALPRLHYGQGLGCHWSSFFTSTGLSPVLFPTRHADLEQPDSLLLLWN